MNEVERGQVWKEKRGAATVIVTGFDELHDDVNGVNSETGLAVIKDIDDFLWEFQLTDKKAKLSYEG